MLIDSHCHLQDKKFGREIAPIVQRATDAGVTAMVCVGYDMPSSRRAVEIADSYDNVYAAIGVHPHDAKDLRPADVDELGKLADSPKVVAIGEIGYDFYRNLSPRDEQERAFRAQLDLAQSLRLPVVIHARDADADSFAALADYESRARSEWPKDRPLGVMHCYAGDLSLALQYIDIGFVISIAGPVSYPGSDKTRAVAKGIPLRWLAVETDAPYLPPQDKRGQRNEPAYVAEVAQYIAELRGDSFAEVCDATAVTTATLFGLGDIGAPTAATAGEAR
ncbi:MAG: TatD family hydrolase [Chloroflexota bacterium]